MTRPSVFDKASFPAAAAPAVDPQPTAAVVSTPEPAKADKDIVKTSTYLPREVHDVLREIAFHERNKVHDLLIEGVEHVLKTRRHPSISELTTPRSGKAS
jgi:hypothetical protein